MRMSRVGGTLVFLVLDRFLSQEGSFGDMLGGHDQRGTCCLLVAWQEVFDDTHVGSHVKPVL